MNLSIRNPYVREQLLTAWPCQEKRIPCAWHMQRVPVIGALVPRNHNAAVTGLRYLLRLTTDETGRTRLFPMTVYYTAVWQRGLNCVHVLSCPTLRPCGLLPCQAPLSVGFPRQEYWSGLPFPSPGHLPDPGILPGRQSFTTEPPGKPYELHTGESQEIQRQHLLSSIF